MHYDHFIQLGKTLNDKIVDPHIRDGNFHYILIPKNENSPIRIDNRLYHVSHNARLVDDYGDITTTLDDHISSLLDDDNLKAYGIIKYTSNGVYIFGVSDYWFFEINGGDFSHISLNVFTARPEKVALSNTSLYSPTHYKDFSNVNNKGMALLSRYGSSDIVIARGQATTANLETKGYSVGFSNMTTYSEYKGDLKYKVRFNIPSTVPEEGNPTIIATFKNHDDDDDRDEVSCNFTINSENAFNGLYRDMIDIDFCINTNTGTTITVAPYRVTVTH